MNPTNRTTMPVPLRNYLREASVAEKLRDLRKLSAWRFGWAVACNYLVIAAVVVAVTAVIPELFTLSWPATIASVCLAGLAGVLIIATRQHALLVLMHEGAHRTVSNNRAVNDFLSDLFCGAPLLVSMRSYRSDHLTHHQHLNTSDDPDWCRKTTDQQQRSQWLFPTTQPLPLMLAKLYTYSVTYLLQSLAANRASTTTPTGIAQPELQPSNKTLGRLRLGLYIAVATVLTITNAWIGFVVFWLVPMLLVLPLIMRIRSIAEHFALRHNHPLRQSRTVRAGLLERALIAPHHIGLHIDHHLLASVPFYNLPALHRLLLECPYYAKNAHLNDGYFVRRRYGYGAIPVLPTSTTLALDMYTLPSARLPPILSGA